jgi:RNA polymerase sigma factor (sigma-70 family)
VDDRALVAALVAGDPRGLEGIYRGYVDRLYTYCRGLLRDPDTAGDAVHDTFVLASQRAYQLRDPERLRSWLYAIARNECLRLLRGRSRQVALAEAGDVSAPEAETDPVAGLRTAEIQELVWAAAAGLNSGDREVFELSVRHELAAPEISEMLGVSVAHAHARLSRARAQLERALGALLVARTGRDECLALGELLGDWDGTLTPLVRKRISRHIESCEICGERQRRQLRPAALFSAYAAAPFLVVPASLWPRVELKCFDPGLAPEREAILDRAGRFDRDSGFPRPLDLRRRRRVRVAGVAAVAVAALLAAGAGALIPPASPAADQPGALPTLPVVASPTGSPAASPTTSPSPSPSPSPTAQASPTGAPPPPPPPVRTTTAPTSGQEPLTFDATAEADCEFFVDYTLVVTVDANLPLDSAEFFMQAGSTSEQSFSMEVDGSSASGESDTQFGREPVEWRVAVTAADGQTAETEPATLTPCQ